METHLLKMEYINWKGETDIRNVIPMKIWYGDSKFHEGKQWFMKAWDNDKKKYRDFALLGIKRFI